MATKLRKNGFNPVVKPSFSYPPTEEMERRAVRIIRNNSNTRAEFLEGVEMLGLTGVFATQSG